MLLISVGDVAVGCRAAPGVFGLATRLRNGGGTASGTASGAEVLCSVIPTSVSCTGRRCVGPWVTAGPKHHRRGTREGGRDCHRSAPAAVGASPRFIALGPPPSPVLTAASAEQSPHEPQWNSCSRLFYPLTGIPDPSRKNDRPPFALIMLRLGPRRRRRRSGQGRRRADEPGPPDPPGPSSYLHLGENGCRRRRFTPLGANLSGVRRARRRCPARAGAAFSSRRTDQGTSRRKRHQSEGRPV